MKKFSEEKQQAIIAKALNRKDKTLRQIADANNVGFSTLGKWLRKYREGNPSHTDKPSSHKLSQAERLQLVLEAAKLDEKALGAYCRERGLYSYQLEQWKDEFMSKNNEQKDRKNDAELKKLKTEIKSLKKELNRKDKALAETSALLILKKKADLIWGDDEED